MGHGERRMIAGGRSGNSECCRDRDAQSRGPSNSKGDLAENERQRTAGRCDKQGADEAGAAM